MFQFSFENETDVEDLLDIPLDEDNKNNENFNQRKNLKTAQITVNKTEVSDIAVSSVFDEEDELLLSVIEEFDSVDNAPVKSKNPDVNHLLEVENTTVSTCDLTSNNFLGISPTSLCQKSFSNISTPFCLLPNSKHSNIKYERKFPGPAGLIAKKSNELCPDNKADEMKNTNEYLNMEANDNVPSETNTWQALLADINSTSCKLLNIISEFTISSIKRISAVRKTPWKIPFFTALIEHLDYTVSDPSIILKDTSDRIHGTLHYDAWEPNSHLLTVGSALLLKQVVVFGVSRKLHVIITTNNIVTICSYQTGRKSLSLNHLLPISEIDYQFSPKISSPYIFKETSSNLKPKKQKLNNEVMDGSITPISISNRATTFNNLDNQQISFSSRNEVINEENLKIKRNSKTLQNKITNTNNNLLPKSTFCDKLEQFRNSRSDPKKYNLPQKMNNPYSPYGDNSKLISNVLDGVDIDSIFGEF